MQKNKPPPSKEELEAQEKAFQEEREAEYAAIREQNAIKRQEDDIKLVEVSMPACPPALTYCYILLLSEGQSNKSPVKTTRVGFISISRIFVEECSP